ncbi:unnamed protein product [Cladocopium goreaui]|uniref:tRNA/tmRNA (Uracil-C(5))-methyltransferase n=1 Tax=Cladocopium goreaui TaxID=2562237 RepID=A0A9P1D0G7_9DINO|nr:unnamed protein product [Cladocopium goreaui]
MESCAFYDCVRKDARKLRPEVVVDVCGGHGALALLFLAHGQAQQATIIDPQRPASHATLREAWSSFVTGPISYDQRPLQQALPEVLKGNSKRMLVVACHACQHLAREIIDHCMAHNTAFAVCPCCPKDHQGHLQAAAKSLEVEFPAAMILAEMGRLTAQHCACALRSFDAKEGLQGNRQKWQQVSPHNRVIFGRPGAGPQEAAETGPIS